MKLVGSAGRKSVLLQFISGGDFTISFFLSSHRHTRLPAPYPSLLLSLPPPFSFLSLLSYLSFSLSFPSFFPFPPLPPSWWPPPSTGLTPAAATDLAESFADQTEGVRERRRRALGREERRREERGEREGEGGAKASREKRERREGGRRRRSLPSSSAFSSFLPSNAAREAQTEEHAKPP